MGKIFNSNAKNISILNTYVWINLKIIFYSFPG